jgi:hypothetical protein
MLRSLRPGSLASLGLLALTGALLSASGCSTSDPVGTAGVGGSDGVGGLDPAGTGAGDSSAGGSSETGSRPGEGGAGAGDPGCTATSAEVCNGVDDDCDGVTDEDCECIEGDARACFSGDPEQAGVGRCVEGVQVCSIDGKWGFCEGDQLPSDETCNGLDDDCDGSVDEGFEPITCGMGECETTVPSCSGGDPQTCTPLDPPDPNEDCDGVDDDCDGMIDEGCACTNGSTQACYTGPSGTEGKGLCKSGTQTCSGGQWGACVGEVKPATETCDAIDQDCDGNVSEGTCSLANATSTCNAGTCAIGSCNAGHSSCDNNAQNGCETRHSGHSNSAPGEDLGIWEADSAYGLGCASGTTCEGPIEVRTGTRGRYFFIDAVEESVCSAYVGLRFDLVVPPGTDYDLYVKGTGCQADPSSFSSISGVLGQDESVVVWCDDVSGSDDSFAVDLEVRHFAGSSCVPWELRVYRRRC